MWSHMKKGKKKKKNQTDSDTHIEGVHFTVVMGDGGRRRVIALYILPDN